MRNDVAKSLPSGAATMPRPLLPMARSLPKSIAHRSPPKRWNETSSTPGGKSHRPHPSCWNPPPCYTPAAAAIAPLENNPMFWAAILVNGSLCLPSLRRPLVAQQHNKLPSTTIFSPTTSHLLLRLRRATQPRSTWRPVVARFANELPAAIVCESANSANTGFASCVPRGRTCPTILDKNKRCVSIVLPCWIFHRAGMP